MRNLFRDKCATCEIPTQLADAMGKLRERSKQIEALEADLERMDKELTALGWDNKELQAQLVLVRREMAAQKAELEQMELLYQVERYGGMDWRKPTPSPKSSPASPKSRNRTKDQRLLADGRRP